MNKTSQIFNHNRLLFQYKFIVQTLLLKKFHYKDTIRMNSKIIQNFIENFSPSRNFLKKRRSCPRSQKMFWNKNFKKLAADNFQFLDYCGYLISKFKRNNVIYKYCWLICSCVLEYHSHTWYYIKRYFPQNLLFDSNKLEILNSNEKKFQF